MYGLEYGPSTVPSAKSLRSWPRVRFLAPSPESAARKPAWKRMRLVSEYPVESTCSMV